MNTELLLKVKAAILAEPRKFDMETWFNKASDSPCGTAACIGGHAVAISRKYKSLKPGLRLNRVSDVGDIAAIALGLGLNRPKRGRLFILSMWPDGFAETYYTARSPKARAKIAAKRIDHFIATEGRE